MEAPVDQTMGTGNAARAAVTVMKRPETANGTWHGHRCGIGIPGARQADVVVGGRS
jgi:hypothetical protein